MTLITCQGGQEEGCQGMFDTAWLFLAREKTAEISPQDPSQLLIYTVYRHGV